MVIVIAQARVRSGARESMQEAAAAVVAQTIGETGCIAYAAHETLGDPLRMVFVERWRTRADFDAHMAAPHTQAFLSLVAQSVEMPPSIETFDVADG